jgi:hypothetical protein
MVLAAMPPGPISNAFKVCFTVNRVFSGRTIIIMTIMSREDAIMTVLLPMVLVAMPPGPISKALKVCLTVNRVFSGRNHDHKNDGGEDAIITVYFYL